MRRGLLSWLVRGAIVVAALWLGTGVPAGRAAQGPNLIQNGDFSSGTANWFQFATPDQSYMVSGVVNGVFEFHRLAPPAGTQNQATIFQLTGTPLSASATVAAQFDLGNTSSARKRISVLILDSDFSDLSVCTFWLEPNTPSQTYGMRTHPTKAWANAALYFYAASTGSNGGNYQLDNVSMNTGAPGQSAARTDCLDPTTPATAALPPGPDLIANGTFASGMTSWATFGQINHQLSSGVFEFQRPPGMPAGVVFQPTSAAIGQGEIVTATFDLGNSSPVRKRVTAILHDLNFSDLTACTFWLAPGQPLLPYAVQSYTNRPWANATLSLYGATVGPDQWMRFDNATLNVTPATPTTGTNCLEFGALGPGPHAPGLLGTHDVGPSGAHSTFMAAINDVTGVVTDIGPGHGTIFVSDSVVETFRRRFVAQEGPVLHVFHSLTGAPIDIVALSSPFGLSNLKYESTTGRVLGIHSVPATPPSTPANAFLSAVDSVTGAIMHIGPGIGHESVSTAAIDPGNHLYFAIEGSTLFVIDTLTGAPVRTVTLSSPAPVRFLQFETSTGQLLGLHTTTTGGPPVTSTSLVTINTVTGAITNLGPSLGNPTLSFTAIDSVQHFYYLEDMTGPTLWVIDTLTGNVVRTVALGAIVGVAHPNFVRAPEPGAMASGARPLREASGPRVSGGR